MDSDLESVSKDIGGAEGEEVVDVGMAVVSGTVVFASAGERRLFRDQKKEMLEQDVSRDFKDSAYRSVLVFDFVVVIACEPALALVCAAPCECTLPCPSAPFVIPDAL